MFRARRLDQLPPYLFVETDRKKREAIAAGRDVIDFGVGDPDLPTHGFIIDRMASAIRMPVHHRYPLGLGMPAFREAVAAFFQGRFGVSVDAVSEVLALIGSKEGLGHLLLAVLNPGDVALIPEPGYPVYTAATIFAGGECHPMPLSERDGWLPALGEIPRDVLRRTKLMFINYPNNPTGACATLSFFQESVALAKEFGFLLVQDAAYSEVYYADPPPSILQVSGAKEVCIELHSLSKTFNMTGWRVGFAVGNKEAIASLAKVKNNVDSGVFGAIQDSAVEALRGWNRAELCEQLATYKGRRDALVSGLRSARWPVQSPEATFFVWARLPNGLTSMAAVSRLLDEANVVAIPGAGFGPYGEGYVRFALTVNEDRTREAAQRIARISW